MTAKFGAVVVKHGNRSMHFIKMQRKEMGLKDTVSRVQFGVLNSAIVWTKRGHGVVNVCMECAKMITYNYIKNSMDVVQFVGSR